MPALGWETTCEGRRPRECCVRPEQTSTTGSRVEWGTRMRRAKRCWKEGVVPRTSLHRRRLKRRVGEVEEWKKRRRWRWEEGRSRLYREEQESGELGGGRKLKLLGRVRRV